MGWQRRDNILHFRFLADLVRTQAQMIEIISIVFPVFALIGLGYVMAWGGAFPGRAVEGIMTFVVLLAAPCLVMRSLLQVRIADAFDPFLLASFYIPLIALFFATFGVSRTVWRRTPGESVSIAFASTFGNTVMLGIPVALGAFGDEALSSVVGIVGPHAAFLYVLGITMMEAVRRDGAGIRAGVMRTIRTVSRNALMIGVLLGVTGNALGVAPLPSVLDTTTRFLAEAAVPAGLFAVGASLPRYRVRAEIGIAGFACFLQLFVQPAATYALGRWVFELDPLLTGVATIVAAMPLGLNGYIFASYYRRSEAAAASGIVLSAPISIATIALWLLVVAPV